MGRGVIEYLNILASQKVFSQVILFNPHDSEIAVFTLIIHLGFL